MKRYLSGLLAAVFLMPTLLPVTASAQESSRVIEDEIILQDPTVAAPRKWVAGASGEYWYVNGPYNTTDAAGNLVTTGRIKGSLPGGNAFIGYGPVTLQYSRRDGKFNMDRDWAPLGLAVISHVDQKQTEDEVTLRWLWKLSKHINPYAIVGYNSVVLDTTDTLPAGWRWGYKSATNPTRRVFNKKTTYNSGLFGGGAIVPFNRYVGARADLRIMSTSGKNVRDDGATSTGTGVGMGMVMTGYGNLVQTERFGLNMQGGFKYQYLKAGKNVDSYARFGLFGSLGATVRF